MNIDVVLLPGLHIFLTSSEPCYRGLALSLDVTWTTYNSENRVALPSGYQPLCAAVLRKTIGTSVRSWEAWMCNGGSIGGVWVRYLCSMRIG